MLTNNHKTTQSKMHGKRPFAGRGSNGVANGGRSQPARKRIPSTTTRAQTHATNQAMAQGKTPATNRAMAQVMTPGTNWAMAQDKIEVFEDARNGPQGPRDINHQYYTQDSFALQPVNSQSPFDGGAQASPAKPVQVMVAQRRILPAKDKHRKALTFKDERGVRCTNLISRSDKMADLWLSLMLVAAGVYEVEFFFWGQSGEYGEPLFPMSFELNDRNAFLKGDTRKEPPRVRMQANTHGKIVTMEKVKLRAPSFVMWPYTKRKPMLVQVLVLAVVRTPNGAEASRELWKTCPTYLWNQPRQNCKEEGIFKIDQDNRIPEDCGFKLELMNRELCATLGCSCKTTKGCGGIVVKCHKDVAAFFERNQRQRVATLPR